MTAARSFLCCHGGSVVPPRCKGLEAAALVLTGRRALTLPASQPQAGGSGSNLAERAAAVAAISGSSEAERFTAAKTAKDALARGLSIFNSQVGRGPVKLGDWDEGLVAAAAAAAAAADFLPRAPAGEARRFRAHFAVRLLA